MNGQCENIASPRGEWACPKCGWVVPPDGRSHAEHERLVAGGWWWCADGHEQTPVVWVPNKEKIDG